MGKKRKSYTNAEKAKIALEAIKCDLTLSQIASKYQVHSTQINTWKKRALEQLPEAFSTKAKRIKAEHHVEVSELYEQIGRLKVENEFLKKKSELFR